MDAANEEEEGAEGKQDESDHDQDEGQHQDQEEGVTYARSADMSAVVPHMPPSLIDVDGGRDADDQLEVTLEPLQDINYESLGESKSPDDGEPDGPSEQQAAPASDGITGTRGLDVPRVWVTHDFDADAAGTAADSFAASSSGALQVRLRTHALARGLAKSVGTVLLTREAVCE